MSSLVDRFATHIEKQLPAHPQRVRRELLTAYEAFGFYQKHWPEKRRSPSRQHLAAASMQFLLDAFSHPDQAALVSIFTPCELLQAFDIHPMCAEMFSTYLNGAGAEAPFVRACEAGGIAETFCSYHKVLMGAAMTGVLPQTAFVINTSLACDANNLTFRAIGRIMGRQPFYIDVPYVKNEDSITYVARQLHALQTWLEKETGRAMDSGRFQQAIARSRQTTALMRQTIPYRSRRWVSGDLTCELYEALMMHNALGTPEALAYAQELLDDCRRAPEDTGLRILWMHTNPFWQKPVQAVLNYNPACHVAATELSYDAWQEITEEDPFRYMAARLVYDPYNGPARDRIEAARKMAEAVRADGVVVFCHWGCKETCGLSTQAKHSLEKAGFPTLVLNGDGVDRHNTSDGQMATRLEAFVEMLEAGK